jgi:hypothetical protein
MDPPLVVSNNSVQGIVIKFSLFIFKYTQDNIPLLRRIFNLESEFVFQYIHSLEEENNSMHSIFLPRLFLYFISVV